MKIHTRMRNNLRKRLNKHGVWSTDIFLENNKLGSVTLTSLFGVSYL